jgi:hypothetical protein
MGADDLSVLAQDSAKTEFFGPISLQFLLNL